MLLAKGDEVVEKLGRVTCDLTNMPASAFETRNSAFSHGSPFGLPTTVTRASFSIEMRVGSADIDLNLVYQNVSYGKASIDY